MLKIKLGLEFYFFRVPYSDYTSKLKNENSYRFQIYKDNVVQRPLFETFIENFLSLLKGVSISTHRRSQK